MVGCGLVMAPTGLERTQDMRNGNRGAAERQARARRTEHHTTPAPLALWPPRVAAPVHTQHARAGTAVARGRTPSKHRQAARAPSR
ncbi:hypothetical protein N2W54_002921 [Lotmaria passim]